MSNIHTAPCGCWVSIFPGYTPRVGMDCEDAQKLMDDISGKLQFGQELPDDLVIEYNRHVAVAVESVVGERAA